MPWSLLFVACAPQQSVPDFSVGNPVPDFTLEDVNATSPTVGQTVGPANYAGMATAWYFGHAT